MRRLTAGLLRQLARDAGLASPSIVIQPEQPPGEAVVLDPCRPMYPASMIKVPLAAVLTTLWASGDLQAAGRAHVLAANMTANDAASPLVPGYVATLEELATLMLTRSDNVATNVLFDVIGRMRATKLAAAMGLSNTHFRRKLSGSLPLIDDPEATGRNAHPALDASSLFSAIARGTLPGARWLYATLLEQEWNDKLSRGLRPGDRFAHKTGETDEASHDGGILDTADGTRFVIVVYTALEAGAASDSRLAAFMSAVRPLLR